jgi:hypothetical protein
LTFDINGWETVPIGHTAHGFRVLRGLGQFRDLIPEDFPHVAMMAHNDILGEEAGEIGVALLAKPFFFGLAEGKRGGDFVCDVNRECPTSAPSGWPPH